MAMIYYIPRWNAKQAMGKAHGGEIQRKPGASFQEFCPSIVTQNALNSSLMQVVTRHARHARNAKHDVLSSREAHWKLRVQGFCWCLDR